MNFKYGWKPSNGNYGDVEVADFNQTPALQAAAGANYSAEYIIDTSKVPTHNQGSLSACAGFATTTCLEILHANETGKYEALSPLFTYYNARVPDHSIGLDDGSFIHNCYYSLTSLGTCSIGMWATNKSFSATPSILAYKEANDNKLSSFHKIYRTGSDRLDDIEMAIRAGLPVVWGTAVGREFENNTSTKALNPPAKKDTLGLHATTLVGVRDNGGKKEYLGLNQWGDNWGLRIGNKGGFFWVNEDYVLDSRSSDFFVGERMTDLLK